MASSSSSLCPRLFAAFNVFGSNFLFIREFLSLVYQFVYFCEEEESVCEQKLVEFRAHIQNCIFFNPSVNFSLPKLFKQLQDVGVSCGVAAACILMPEEEICVKCSRKLSFTSDKKTHVVVVYHSERGTGVGSRVTKVCRNCKIHYHFGYRTCNKGRYYSTSVLDKEYLLVSEDTAIHISLLEQLECLLVLGAVPFSTFADSYNRRFKYSRSNGDGEDERRFKRKKR